jgi:plastocyanin
MRRHKVLLIVATLAFATLPAAAAPTVGTPPVYEPRVLPVVGQVVPGGACTPESAFELGITSERDVNRYQNCQRLQVVFGPIWAKPGQNDVLIQPVTFEKPMYPGYLTRFKPDLVGADGQSPRVKDLHLHHGTWLNPGYLGGADAFKQLPADPMRSYGSGPWIASGEEKTIAEWPYRYGLKILPSDQWLFLHMIHNATPQTFPVWVTYSLDFVPEETANAVQPDGRPLINNTRGVWLDVGDCSWADACEKDSLNPIFNIQRGYGDNGICKFPTNNCAQQNTLAKQSAQQGVALPTVPRDEVTIQQDGTLVVMGGHVHFGGLADKVWLVRNGEERLIHVSDALYWDDNYNPNADHTGDEWDLSKNIVGGNPSSWDMVMTGTTKDLGWSILVKKGDKLRLEGVYDSRLASWYEEMGIVMTWLAPGDTSGVDPFDPNVTIDTHPSAIAQNPPTVSGYTLPGDVAGEARCTPSATTICVRGQATHARIQTSGDHWRCALNGCPDTFRLAPNGPAMREIHIGGFEFGVAAEGVAAVLGVPTVRVGEPVTFTNVDTADYMWHTITRCANPCTGTTSASYPQADGAWDDLAPTSIYAGITDPDARGDALQQWITNKIAADGPDPMDFDSGQLGNVEAELGTVQTSWTFTPTRPGTYPFFCRIHPSMRGAIRVLPAA